MCSWLESGTHHWLLSNSNLRSDLLIIEDISLQTWIQRPPPFLREEERQTDRYIYREGEGAGERQRKGLEWGNSNDLLGTKGLEKLQKSML